MAREVGRSAADLEDDLIENGPEYDFFQAVRLLLLLQKRSAVDEDNVSVWPLNIRPELNLDYSDSQISEIIDLGGKGFYEILTSFLGLYGVSSPLPAFYTEDLLDDEWDDHTAGREFLDIIHNQLYEKLYKAWLKYQFLLNTVENQNDLYSEILNSLVGLKDNDFVSRLGNQGQFNRYLGIFSVYPRSAESLRVLLSDYLEQPNIFIEQCVPNSVNISEDQKIKLGQANSYLGETTSLGSRISESSTTFRINIAGFTEESLAELLASKEKLGFIANSIHYFLVHPLRYSIQLIVDCAGDLVLGNPAWSSLGKSSWLGVSDKEITRTVILEDSDLAVYITASTDSPQEIAVENEVKISKRALRRQMRQQNNDNASLDVNA